MAEKSESKRNDSVEVIQAAAICQRTCRAPSSRPRAQCPSADHPRKASAARTAGAAAWCEALRGPRVCVFRMCCSPKARTCRPRRLPEGSGSPGPAARPDARSPRAAPGCGRRGAPNFPYFLPQIFLPCRFFLPHWEPGNRVNNVSNT